MKPFSQWSKEEVEEEFGLYADHSYGLLQEWIAVLPSVSDEEQRILRRLSQKLLMHVHDWNEEELKVFSLPLFLILLISGSRTIDRFSNESCLSNMRRERNCGALWIFLLHPESSRPESPSFFCMNTRNRRTHQTIRQDNFWLKWLQRRRQILIRTRFTVLILSAATGISSCLTGWSMPKAWRMMRQKTKSWQ